MQYIIVRFREPRGVLIDGLSSGSTGTVLHVNAGRHTVKLDGLQNFKPRWRRPDIKGTTPGKPMEVTFA